MMHIVISFVQLLITTFHHFCWPFVCSLVVLHQNKLTHTDLKPENILFVDSDCDVKYNSKLVSWFQFSNFHHLLLKRPC